MQLMKNKTAATHAITLVVILLFLDMLVHVTAVKAELICHQCQGINCLRTNYNATQKCLNVLDICVNVFDGQTLLAQGCWEQLPEGLRDKCGRENENFSECFKCNENLCNSLSANSFKCLQCDSNRDANCSKHPLSLVPLRCAVSRTPNQYCFVRQEGVRVSRGCSYTLEEQMSCYLSDDCMLCQPSELKGCNNIETGAEDVNNGSAGDTGNHETGNDAESEGSHDGGSEGGSEEPSGNDGGGENGTADGGSNGSNNNGTNGSEEDGSHHGANCCSINTLHVSILNLIIIIACFINK